MLSNSVFFGVFISILAYDIGLFIKKKTKLTIFNPMLIALCIVISFLLLTKVEYESYYESAKYLSYLLTPTTVCLAIPLYEQIEALKKNFKAIMAGILSGVITSLTCILALSAVFKLDYTLFASLLPKSITTAIAMSISEEMGGIVTLTVVVIMFTGLIGNIFAEKLCKIFKIKDSIAKGVAIGTAAHSFGTAKAMELGEVEGAMSSLSIAVAGILTVIIAPLFAYLY